MKKIVILVPLLLIAATLLAVCGSDRAQDELPQDSESSLVPTLNWTERSKFTPGAMNHLEAYRDPYGTEYGPTQYMQFDGKTIVYRQIYYPLFWLGEHEGYNINAVEVAGYKDSEPFLVEGTSFSAVYIVPIPKNQWGEVESAIENIASGIFLFFSSEEFLPEMLSSRESRWWPDSVSALAAYHNLESYYVDSEGIEFQPALQMEFNGKTVVYREMYLPFIPLINHIAHDMDIIEIVGYIKPGAEEGNGASLRRNAAPIPEEDRSLIQNRLKLEKIAEGKLILFYNDSN